jgi:CPA1 family monovalent cation:H+ antiporter
VGASLLAVLVVSVLLAAAARRVDVSAPLALVVAGLAIGLIPGFKEIELDPELVLYVLLPPLLWSAGLESSYVALRRNVRPIGLLAVGLPLATTFAVGFVAYKTVPELTVAAALTLGAIVAPPDAVSATAVGRRLGLPRRIMTLLGRLRLEMLAAERATFIAERDSGRIDDEVLRSVLHGLDLEEATLNRA